MSSATSPQKIIRSGDSFHEFKKASDVKNFPNLFADYVKSFGDLYFWEKGNFHVITKMDHAKEILTSADYSADRGAFFVSRMPNLDLSLIQDFFGVVKKMMVMSDDEGHQKRRKVATAGFEDHILERFQKVMKKTIARSVAALQGQREFDFVATLSKLLPSTVLADLFSIPEADRLNFLHWSNVMTGFFGGASAYSNEDGIEVNQAALSLRNYFQTLVKERKLNPGEDYVSLVLQLQEQFGLTHDELISQLIMMLVAGMSTTTDQINNCMFLLTQDRELQQRLRLDKKLIPAMLEECKRFDPAVTFIFRIARRDTQLGYQPIKKGEVMFISTHAVNRDLPAATQPHELRLERKVPHLAYGHGAHYCLGAKLARMEMVTLFEEICSQLPILVLDESQKTERDHYSLSFSGFKNLFLKTEMV